jgi:hypothetical protein
MATTGLHRNAQNQAEGISRREVGEQAHRVGAASTLLTLEAVTLAAKTLMFMLAIFKILALFLKNKAQAAAKAMRQGIPNKIQSLQDYLAQETNGAVKIGQNLPGDEREQAARFMQLLNTSAGQQAPEGMENTLIAPWGKNLIVVDANNQVTVNFIQPLMDSAVITAAMNDLVPSAVAPGIRPIEGSLASNEADIQTSLIASDAIDEMLKKQAESQLAPELVGDDSEQPIPVGKYVSAPLTPQLCNDLATVAQLHQVGTIAESSSLPLIQKGGGDKETSVVIAQESAENGDATYYVTDQGDTTKDFSFKVNRDQIVTNFRVSDRASLPQTRQLVQSIASITTQPDHTDLQLHPESNIDAIQTVQGLSMAADDIASKPVATTIMLDYQQFDIKTDQSQKNITIVEPATSASMTFGKRGIKDRGLLKIMLKTGHNGQRLAANLINRAREKANDIKTVVDNAIPQSIGETKEAAVKIVDNLAADIKGLISTAQTAIAPNPAVTVASLKGSERIGESEEDRVKAIDVSEEATFEESLQPEIRIKVTPSKIAETKIQSKQQLSI